MRFVGTCIRLTVVSATLCIISSSVNAQTVLDRIRQEGLQNSKVMETLSYLSDVIGPRLSGSPQLKRANEWTRDTMKGWGLENGKLEAWGPFGRGWTLEKFSAQVTEPYAIPLIAFPKAWSPGLKGHVSAPVVVVDAKDEAGLEAFKGKLKGMIVLSGDIRETKAHFTPEGARHTDAQLQTMADAKPTVRGAGGGRPRNFQMTPEMQARFQFAGKKAEFFLQEGAIAVLEPSTRGDGGTLFVQSASVPGASLPGGGGPGAPRRVSSWDPKPPTILPQIVVAAEHYNRMVRIARAGEKIKLDLDLKVQFHDKDLMCYNTTAEIPGTDLKDQIVMLGGHIDSWHGGTGATDNGAGVAVAMEAVRILKALNLQPRRTIRVGLWSGEEEGLMGSRAYVGQHFAERGTAAADGTPGELKKKPEFDKISGYFNLDNGTGKIRGIYLQGNEKVGPLFADWLKPFADLGATTVTINNTGGTDHQSFDGVGIPGFQFIQDEIEYDTRTHHSNMDVFDRIQADDMKQAATIMAWFVYNTAMRDEPLPRKAR